MPRFRNNFSLTSQQYRLVTLVFFQRRDTHCNTIIRRICNKLHFLCLWFYFETTCLLMSSCFHFCSYWFENANQYVVTNNNIFTLSLTEFWIPYQQCPSSWYLYPLLSYDVISSILLAGFFCDFIMHF